MAAAGMLLPMLSLIEAEQLPGADELDELAVMIAMLALNVRSEDAPPFFVMKLPAPEAASAE